MFLVRAIGSLLINEVLETADRGCAGSVGRTADR